MAPVRNQKLGEGTSGGRSASDKVSSKGKVGRPPKGDIGKGTRYPFTRTSGKDKRPSPPTREEVKIEICQAVRAHKAIWKGNAVPGSDAWTKAWKSVAAKLGRSVHDCQNYYNAVKKSFSTKIYKIISESEKSITTWKDVDEILIYENRNRKQTTLFQVWLGLPWLSKEIFSEVFNRRINKHILRVNPKGSKYSQGSLADFSLPAPANRVDGAIRTQELDEANVNSAPKEKRGSKAKAVKKQAPPTFMPGSQDIFAPLTSLDVIKQDVDEEEEQSYLRQGPPIDLPEMPEVRVPSASASASSSGQIREELSLLNTKKCSNFSTVISAMNECATFTASDIRKVMELAPLKA